jgi:hypothetical protein
MNPDEEVKIEETPAPAAGESLTPPPATEPEAPATEEPKEEAPAEAPAA